MKVKMNNKMMEVYKVQLALFGGPSVLIYNEDRTQMLEITDHDSVEEIADFMNENVKVYAAGKLDKNGKIHLEKVLTDAKYFF